MGSVNRDFVFTELQAGEQTHNSHMDSHTDQREGGAGYVLYRQQTERCTCSGSVHTRSLRQTEKHMENSTAEVEEFPVFI